MGVVTAVGAEVDDFKVGDLAGVGCMVESCRSCALPVTTSCMLFLVVLVLRCLPVVGQFDSRHAAG